jgi:hypothetical protein
MLLTFLSAVAEGYGGAVFCDDNSHIIIQASSFTGNQALYGGALFLWANSTGECELLAGW